MHIRMMGCAGSMTRFTMTGSAGLTGRQCARAQGIYDEFRNSRLLPRAFPNVLVEIRVGRQYKHELAFISAMPTLRVAPPSTPSFPKP